MLYPTIFGEGLFDDLMNFSFPRFRDFDDTERKLYGKNAAHVMKTDVREHDDQFEVDIDLPGFKKEEIQLNLESGYLTVSAAKALEEEKNNKQGKLIRQERYTGTMQRSFYVGENVTEEDIKAKFEDGVLKLNIPKKEAVRIPEKKTIMIEG
ncbi:MAG: Hsp20/alpha crystallin family protein [Lachnospiraceae bacterium]|nr:Hsp20/alpha crystallin family protein [Lachnospiraceae bacterium]